MAPALVSAIAAAPSSASIPSSDRIWVGYSDGSLFRATDGNSAMPTWNRADDSTIMPSSSGRLCTRVTIDPMDVKKVYACFAGYSSDNLWKTVNDGAHWTNIGSSLPAVTIHDLAIHPANPDYLYVASDVGVFASENGGVTWWPTNLGPANVAVFQLFWMNRILVAVTHGRGLFWISLPEVPAPPPAAT